MGVRPMRQPIRRKDIWMGVKDGVGTVQQRKLSGMWRREELFPTMPVDHRSRKRNMEPPSCMKRAGRDLSFKKVAKTWKDTIPWAKPCCATQNKRGWGKSAITSEFSDCTTHFSYRTPLERGILVAHTETQARAIAQCCLFWDWDRKGRRGGVKKHRRTHTHTQKKVIALGHESQEPSPQKKRNLFFVVVVVLRVCAFELGYPVPKDSFIQLSDFFFVLACRGLAVTTVQTE